MTYYAGTTNLVVTLSTGVDLTTVLAVWVRTVAPKQSLEDKGQTQDVLGDIQAPATAGLVEFTIAGPLQAGTYKIGTMLRYADRNVTAAPASLPVEEAIIPADPSP